MSSSSVVLLPPVVVSPMLVLLEVVAVVAVVVVPGSGPLLVPPELELTPPELLEDASAMSPVSDSAGPHALRAAPTAMTMTAVRTRLAGVDRSGDKQNGQARSAPRMWRAQEGQGSMSVR